MQLKALLIIFSLFCLVGVAIISAPLSITPAATVAAEGLAKPTSTPTYHLMQPYTIAGLRARTYTGGTIRIREVYRTFDNYTRYLVDYPSDGLTITAVMQVPNGAGPFPVIILNHGYIRRDLYWSGAGTWEAADYLSNNGYMTIAPDYRSWGESDSDMSFFHTGLVTDVINLVSSLSSLSFADTSRIGMWGHSMGGGITTKVLTVDTRIRAAVLYAPNSSDDADIIGLWGTGCNRERRFTRRCNGADVLPSDMPEAMFLAYEDAALLNSDMMQQIAPYYHLSLINAPIQVHIGTVDDVTPPAWSVKLQQGLLEAGKYVEFYSYEGQGHLFVGEGWLLFMERVLAFYDEQLDVRR